MGDGRQSAGTFRGAFRGYRKKKPCPWRTRLNDEQRTWKPDKHFHGVNVFSATLIFVLFQAATRNGPCNWLKGVVVGVNISTMMYR